MNLSEEIMEKAGKELADEIDFQILTSMFKEMGWTEIEFDPHVENLLAYEIHTWIKANCKGHVQSRGKRWLFENKQDAAWFILRWGE